jgi:hypothetical protein
MTRSRLPAYSLRWPVALLGALAFGCAAPAAHAYVYWTDAKPGAVARADLDGTAINTRFIRARRRPQGVAVDAKHVYWTNAGSIGRANLRGRGAKQHFISGLDHPRSLAVDSGHIYWTTGPNGGIGRANLDGSGVDPHFITGLRNPLGVTVNAAHIYWAEPAVEDHLDGSIGRADLDGSGANDRFITDTWEKGEALNFDPIAVAVHGSHIFWSNNVDGSIGRADLDGAHPKPSLVRGAEALGGVAVHGSHIYWTVYSGETAPRSVIMRASLNGTRVNRHFVTGLREPGDVAVDGRGPVRPPPRRVGGFLSPDHNIWCEFDSYVRFCGSRPSARSQAQRSAFFRRNGKVGFCHVRRVSLADACYQNWGNGEPVLRYGQRTKTHGVLCSSRRNGITCVLDKGPKRGHGFRINRRHAVRVPSRRKAAIADARAKRACGKMTVDGGSLGTLHVRVVRIGSVSCAKARKLARKWIRRRATGHCGQSNNFCVLHFRGGWTCSAFSYGESQTAGGAQAGCFRRHPRTKIRLYY